MTKNLDSRAAWKHVLASTVVALTMTSTCAAERGDWTYPHARSLDFCFDEIAPDYEPKIGQRSDCLAARSQTRFPLDPSANNAYKPTFGPHTVAHVRVCAQGKLQSRIDDSSQVTYPKSTGQFPIILIFCTDANSNRATQDLAAYWASHGYVALHVSDPNPQHRPPRSEPHSIKPIAQLLHEHSIEFETTHAAIRGKVDWGRIGLAQTSDGNSKMIVSEYPQSIDEQARTLSATCQPSLALAFWDSLFRGSTRATEFLASQNAQNDA